MTEPNYTGILQMGNDDDIIFGTSTDHTYSTSISDITTATIDIISDEDLTFNISDININNASTISDGNLTITIDDTHWSDNITWEQTEFVDTMPSLNKIKDMCQHYPGLEKAFKNFESIYKMVHQDYKGNHEPEAEVPF